MSYLLLRPAVGIVRSVDWLYIVGAIWVALLVPALVGMGRMVWRICRHNEPMVSGGSMGDQILGARNPGASAKQPPLGRRGGSAP